MAITPTPGNSGQPARPAPAAKPLQQPTRWPGANAANFVAHEGGNASADPRLDSGGAEALRQHAADHQRMLAPKNFDARGAAPVLSAEWERLRANAATCDTCKAHVAGILRGAATQRAIDGRRSQEEVASRRRVPMLASHHTLASAEVTRAPFGANSASPVPSAAADPTAGKGTLNTVKQDANNPGGLPISPIISVQPQSVGHLDLYNTKDASALSGGVPARAEERPTPTDDITLDPDAFHEGGHQPRAARGRYPTALEAIAEQALRAGRAALHAPRH